MSKYNKPFKDICDSALEFTKVTNAEELYAALPAVFAVKDAVKVQEDCAKTGKEIIEKVLAACSAYAVKHPTCFDEGLNEFNRGVQVGDATIDDVRYHFSHGFNGYERTKGGNMTQDFLATLPSKWTSKMLKLDVKKVEATDPDEDALNAAGIRRKVKDTWSIEPSDNG